eukprot:COSAG01_NODE_15040_length_1381_cov_1.180967_2_plen_84_part_01
MAAARGDDAVHAQHALSAKSSSGLGWLCAHCGDAQATDVLLVHAQAWTGCPVVTTAHRLCWRSHCSAGSTGTSSKQQSRAWLSA